MSDEPNKGGRPSVYSAELANEVCARLADGESLRTICGDKHIPAVSTVQQWIIKDLEGFSAQYARARDAALDLMADAVIGIADDKTGDAQRDRLRFDARRWYLSKLAPKRYGDKVTQEIVGDPNKPLVTRIEIVAAGGNSTG